MRHLFYEATHKKEKKIKKQQLQNSSKFIFAQLKRLKKDIHMLILKIIKQHQSTES